MNILVIVASKGPCKRMKILEVLAPKGPCKRMKILEVLAPKGLWYGMVIDISHWENPPPPLVRSYVWIYCAKSGLGVCLNCFDVVLFTLGQLLSSPCISLKF